VGLFARAADGRQHPLAARCLVGRGPSSSLVLDDRFVSEEHAKLLWNGQSWQVRDLGSRNGTFVDGRRLDPGELAPLKKGSVVAFGDEERWTLVDPSAPVALAIAVDTGEIRSATSGILVLPDDEHPELTVHLDPLGTGWRVLESEGETALIGDRATVSAGGRSWRLELPGAAEATPVVQMPMKLDNVTLRLGVTPDEETVEVEVVLRGEATKLEPRGFGYLLVVLARARRQDEQLPPAERGWRKVTDLSRMLKLDPNSLNVAIHRARLQLAAIGLEDATGIVDVRRGERRIGTERFEVLRLAPR
jgi:hypothetical protein